MKNEKGKMKRDSTHGLRTANFLPFHFSLLLPPVPSPQSPVLGYSIFLMMADCSGLSHQNVEKSLVLASALFPLERWVVKEPGVWVAESRLFSKSRERAKLTWEIELVRILVERGSAVFFLPEIKDSDALGVLSADTVINGEVVEIKAVSGTRATLGHEFRKGYKQGAYLAKQCPEIQSHSVFVRLFSDLSIPSVKAKIAGELKTRPGSGSFICYFELSGKLYTWTYEELRAMIRR